MKKQSYKLTFLPLFEEDLIAITDYIANMLNNPSAAHSLIDDIELAIINRLKMPLSFAPYKSSKLSRHTYYRINVRNFSVFYVVIGNTMEVRRLLYSKQNIDKLLSYGAVALRIKYTAYSSKSNLLYKVFFYFNATAPFLIFLRNYCSVSLISGLITTVVYR